MRISDRYVFSLALVYMFTTVSLSFYGGNGLDLYVSLYIVEFFILTLLHSPFNPRAQKMVNVLSYALFAVFIVIVALKVLEILVGSTFL